MSRGGVRDRFAMVSSAHSCENLPRGALARLQGAVHEPRPARRGLTPRKVNPAARSPQGRADRRENPRRVQPAVAAGTPFVLDPVAIDVAGWSRCTLPEEAHE